MLRVVVLGLRKPLRVLPLGNVPKCQHVPVVCKAKFSVISANQLEVSPSKEEDQVSSFKNISLKILGVILIEHVSYCLSTCWYE